jgi:hypothetical protein
MLVVSYYPTSPTDLWKLIYSHLPLDLFWCCHRWQDLDWCMVYWQNHQMEKLWQDPSHLRQSETPSGLTVSCQNSQWATDKISIVSVAGCVQINGYLNCMLLWQMISWTVYTITILWSTCERLIQPTLFFFRIPEKVSTSPNYKYRRDALRNREARRRLDGWECEQCKNVS